MFVSTSRLQLNRPTTADERHRLEEIYGSLAKEPGFRAFYLAQPSETENAAVVIFDSEAELRTASEQVAPAIHAIVDPMLVGTQGESGEVNSEYINWSTPPGFLSVRRAQMKDSHSPAERKPFGRRYADAAAKLPEGRHAFIEFWPSDTALVHLGVYDSRDSRTSFMQRLGPVLQAQPGVPGFQMVPPVQETTGDIWAYRVK